MHGHMIVQLAYSLSFIWPICVINVKLAASYSVYTNDFHAGSRPQAETCRKYHCGQIEKCLIEPCSLQSWCYFLLNII
jgi:hypothetical protein